MDTQSLTLALGDATHAGRTFDVMPVAGEEPVLQVTVSGAEETPVYITVTDTQILCLAYGNILRSCVLLPHGHFLRSSLRCHYLLADFAVRHGGC